MRVCRECGGPLVICQRCHHSHCDDEQCIDMPIDCARWVQE